MDIILLEDVEKLGDKHTVVTVKNGFGRNYLIPKGLALIANSSNQRRLNELKRMEDAKEIKKLDDYRAILTALEGAVVKVAAKAGTSGKIFGSVNSLQISQAIKEQYNVEVDKSKIKLLEEVKVLGTYTADLVLHSQVKGTLNFEVLQD